MERKIRIADKDLHHFQQSLRRIEADEGFYEAFYGRFIGQSEAVGAIFRNRDMASIIGKLRVTLGMVAEAAEGKPGLEMYLEMLGGIHRRLQIGPRFFVLWREALLDTLFERDPAFNPTVRGAWERVIAAVIDCMQQAE